MVPPPTPSCPRCNYNLSGPITTWTTSCPLTGTCPECGLTFHWHDVLHPDQLTIPGFIEHARGLRTLTWAWITWAWTLWPAVFWRKVRIEHRPRMLRCILWLAILILPLHALIAGARTVQAWREYLDWTAARPAAVRRAGIAAPTTVGHFPWPYALSPWCEPLVALKDGSWYPGTVFRGGSAPSAASLTVRPRLTDWPLFVPALAAASITIPVILLVLPVTRRRAKVRASLVWRSAIYGGAWIVLPVLAWEAAFAGAVAHQLSSPTIWATWPPTPNPPPTWTDPLSWPRRSLIAHPLPWFIASTIWVALWWRLAIRTMFQGHSPRSVMAAAFIAATLSALIMLVTSKETVFWLLSLPGSKLIFPPNHP